MFAWLDPLVAFSNRNVCSSSAPLRRESSVHPQGREAGRAYLEELSRWLSDGHLQDIDHDNLLLQESSVPTRRPAPLQEGRYILLADDNADLRGYVGRLLASAGYEVEAVGDGLAALRAAQERKPDLVVTDVMMPDLDGFGLLEQIRADPDLRQIPVIFTAPATLPIASRFGSLQSSRCPCADDFPLVLGPPAAIQVAHDRFALGGEAETGFSLPICADAEISDELAVMGLHVPPFAAVAGSR
jgi:CheY-like chemotaxis protein